MGRGGYIKDITIENIVMSKIEGDCITMSFNYGVKTLYDIANEVTDYREDDLPVVDGIKISGVVCDSSSRFLNIEGFAESPIKNITLRNCRVNAAREMNIVNAQGVTFDNVTVNGRKC